MIKLWTTGDIAQELEVSTSVVNKWKQNGELPEPFAVVGGKDMPVWDDAGVKQIIKGYYDRTEPQREKKRVEAREEWFIENVLTWQDGELTQLGSVAQYGTADVT